jgi:predicted kinase
MEAVIFIGIQGSGKSTFYRERFFDTHVRINLDMLRTRRREQILFDACLAAQQSLVIDNTNPTKTDRARYIAAARNAGFRIIAYFFKSTVRDAIQRNNQRKLKAKIPPAAIAGTFKKLEPPSGDEGFDEIFTVEVATQGGFTVTPAGQRALSEERQS